MRLLVFAFSHKPSPPAREWNHIGSDVILAEDLERLVVRRASLVNEIVDALLARCQFRSLPNKRTQSAESKALLINSQADPPQYDAAGRAAAGDFCQLVVKDSPY